MVCPPGQDSLGELYGSVSFRQRLPDTAPHLSSEKALERKVRQTNAPLFPGYVCCQFDSLKRLPILVTPGVISVVGRGRVPLPVNDSEIAAIQMIVTSGFHAEPWPYLEVGQKIRIEGESLSGLEGILIQFKGNNRIVVSVSLLRRSVALEIDRDCVRPVSPARVTGLGSVAANALFQGVVA